MHRVHANASVVWVLCGRYNPRQRRGLHRGADVHHLHRRRPMRGLDAVESDRREHPIDGLPERLRTQRRLPRSRRESRRWYVQRDDAGADERHSGRRDGGDQLLQRSGAPGDFGDLAHGAPTDWRRLRHHPDPSPRAPGLGAVRGLPVAGRGQHRLRHGLRLRRELLHLLGPVRGILLRLRRSRLHVHAPTRRNCLFADGRVQG
mmetsp:Transcript_49258/g.116048  ORF Transcript_49258/g.116048 Transcript_49258/m.116048 type:complete len:204 (-) Transcript_49258:226-837(-)